MAQSNKVTFIFEVLDQATCNQQSWHTRYDPSKYAEYYERCSNMIRAAVPSAQVIINQVPKEWAQCDIYMQMIPNDDDNAPYYEMLPRLGAFEVSTVINGQDILLYSKLMSSMWPHARALATRCKELVDQIGTAAPQDLKTKYTTSGQQVRAAREVKNLIEQNRNRIATSSTSNLYSSMAKSQKNIDGSPQKGQQRSESVQEINASASQQKLTREESKLSVEQQIAEKEAEMQKLLAGRDPVAEPT